MYQQGELDKRVCMQMYISVISLCWASVRHHFMNRAASLQRTNSVAHERSADEWVTDGGEQAKVAQRSLKGAEKAIRKKSGTTCAGLNFSLILFVCTSDGSFRISARRPGSWLWLRPRLWWRQETRMATARLGWKVSVWGTSLRQSWQQMRKGYLYRGAVHNVVLKFNVCEKQSHHQTSNQISSAAGLSSLMKEPCCVEWWSLTEFLFLLHRVLRYPEINDLDCFSPVLSEWVSDGNPDLPGCLTQTPQIICTCLLFSPLMFVSWTKS